METLDQSVALGVATAVPDQRRISNRRAWRTFCSLVLASAICVLMVLFRRTLVGYTSYRFLIWNLILAWIPLGFSYLTYRLHALGKGWRSLLIGCALAWFVFFPNAPYIVTDFVHISPRYDAPEWLDIVTLISSAWTGLCLGYLSLYLMQEIVREHSNRFASWVFALVMLALGSVGVFCGRFLRWNSWDLLRDPLRKLQAAPHVHRFSYPGDVIFLGTLFLFLLLSYCSLFSLTHLYDHEGR